MVRKHIHWSTVISVLLNLFPRICSILVSVPLKMWEKCTLFFCQAQNIFLRKFDLSNQIQKYIKWTLHHEKVRFTPGVQCRLNIKKSKKQDRDSGVKVFYIYNMLFYLVYKLLRRKCWNVHFICRVFSFSSCSISFWFVCFETLYPQLRLLCSFNELTSLWSWNVFISYIFLFVKYNL
jgi:hypothetical protein